MAENEHYRPEQEELQPIDPTELFFKMWRQFGKTWWLLLILMVLGAGLMLGWQHYVHTNQYESYASFSVSAGSGAGANDYYYYTRVSLARLGQSFPYILESSALLTIVREELGLSSLPVTISASVVNDTSLLRISVQGTDPVLTTRVLDTVIEKYPEVARYVIGKTSLTLLDYSGVPTVPINAISHTSSIVRGAQLAIVVYLLILVLLAITRRTIESADDLKKYTSIRCLSTIPQTYLKKRSKRKQLKLLVGQKSVSPAFTEAVHLLRIRTLRELDREKGKVLLVTSAGEMEGKTTVAANLALSCAQKGFRVLLVDCDLRHPSVGELFGLTAETGLIDVLRGNCPANEAIQAYADTTLSILPGHGTVRPEQIPRLFAQSETGELVKQLRKDYDYVIMDSPPSGFLQDALTLASHCDAALAVIRQNYLTRARILEFLDILTDSGIRIIGCVINGEEGEIGSYGYGRYGYGRAYGKYGYNSKYSYGYGTKAHTNAKENAGE